MIVSCALCGEDMDADSPGAYQRVVGWQRNKGHTSLRLRKRLHEYAHKTCVDSRRKGRPGQGTLDV